MKIVLSPATLAAIEQHARDTYPDECCGLVIVRDQREQAVRITNIQNLMHEKDPAQFPRTARIAYTMQESEAAPLLVAADKGEVELRAFYHSHPEHDAYFSDEDKRQAMVWGEPSYPNAGQIVVSIYGGEIKVVKGFGWDGERGDFADAAVITEPE